MTRLNEGLKTGDLEGLILPLLSIDEFESKISDDAIVVAFFVDDEPPAQDLKRFIEKGYITLLDVDISPAPNESGYFLVFLEFIRDYTFPEKFMAVIQAVENLTDIDKWRFRSYGEGKLHDLTLKNLKKYVRLQSKESEQKMDIGLQKLKESIADSISLEGTHLILEKAGFRQSYQFIDYDTLNNLLVNHKLYDSSIALTESSWADCNKLAKFLGQNWSVNKIQEYFLVTLNGSDKAILLKS
jgi:hypothetical protein